MLVMQVNEEQSYLVFAWGRMSYKDLYTRG